MPSLAELRLSLLQKALCDIVIPLWSTVHLIIVLSDNGHRLFPFIQSFWLNDMVARHHHLWALGILSVSFFKPICT